MFSGKRRSTYIFCPTAIKLHSVQCIMRIRNMFQALIHKNAHERELKKYQVFEQCDLIPLMPNSYIVCECLGKIQKDTCTLLLAVLTSLGEQNLWERNVKRGFYLFLPMSVYCLNFLNNALSSNLIIMENKITKKKYHDFKLVLKYVNFQSKNVVH